MANTAEKINRHLLAAETKDENMKNNIQFLQIFAHLAFAKEFNIFIL